MKWIVLLFAFISTQCGTTVLNRYFITKQDLEKIKEPSIKLKTARGKEIVMMDKLIVYPSYGKPKEFTPYNLGDLKLISNKAWVKYGEIRERIEITGGEKSLTPYIVGAGIGAIIGTIGAVVGASLASFSCVESEKGGKTCRSFSDRVPYIVVSSFGGAILGFVIGDFFAKEDIYHKPYNGPATILEE